MGARIRKAARLATVVILSGLIGLAISYSIFVHERVPAYEKITSVDNNAPDLDFDSQQKTIERARKSAVRVLSTSDDDEAVIASSIGTYFTMDGRYFVITTMHGILGPCESTRILSGDDIYPCERFIELNQISDYALIEIYEIDDRQPIHIPRSLPSSKKEWNRSLSMMSRTLYTGFPNSLGPLTIPGTIAGYSHGGNLYILSYAWSGSSGSGVFSSTGDYIGYVIAIDVGSSVVNGYQVLENVVLVVPAYKVDWSTIMEYDDLVPQEEKETN